MADKLFYLSHQNVQPPALLADADDCDRNAKLVALVSLVVFVAKQKRNCNFFKTGCPSLSAGTCTICDLTHTTTYACALFFSDII